MEGYDGNALLNHNNNDYYLIWAHHKLQDKVLTDFCCLSAWFFTHKMGVIAIFVSSKLVRVGSQ